MTLSIGTLRTSIGSGMRTAFLLAAGPHATEPAGGVHGQCVPMNPGGDVNVRSRPARVLGSGV
ncbi:hypothetical protein GCM10020220_112870 [Nonomuraea rubra]